MTFGKIIDVEFHLFLKLPFLISSVDMKFVIDMKLVISKPALLKQFFLLIRTVGASGYQASSSPLVLGQIAQEGSSSR